MQLTVFDVDHGSCTLIQSPGQDRRIALIDCGHNAATGWRPSSVIRNVLRRNGLDYLIITNADEDHLSDLPNVKALGVSTLIRNNTIPVADLRAIKEQGGPISPAMERYLEMHRDYTHPVTIPFDQGMGGITIITSMLTYPDFQDTNNLSMLAFIEYRGFVMAFPGDLERPGWLAHLERKHVRDALGRTTVLMASHHGRESGFCEEVFKDNSGRLCEPAAVIVSDKSIEYKTQETIPQYQHYVSPDGIVVEGEARRRHVLTTRRDGAISFDVSPDGSFSVRTSGG